MFSMTRPIGFAGERKAVALLFLSMYMAFFGFLALIFYLNQEPEWGGCFIALLLCYGIGFFSVASGWFWGRWFAIGLGYSGLTTAAWGLVSLRELEPTLLIYGLTHGIIALFLQGERLAAQFDDKPGWKEQLGLDEEAVYRIRKTVTRVASSLPTLILFALAPRETQILIKTIPIMTLQITPLSCILVPLLLIGLFGVLRAKTWGIFVIAMTGLGTLFAWFNLSHVSMSCYLRNFDLDLRLTENITSNWNLLAGCAFAWLIAAVVPFIKPSLQFVTRRSAA